MRLVALASVALLIARPTAAQDLTRFTYRDALARALAANPAIIAAQTRRAIGAAAIAVAGERLNPEGRVEIDRDEPHQAYSVSLPIELGGKRGKRVAVATAEAGATEAGMTQLIVETRNAVRRSFFDRIIADGRLAALQELQAILTRARDAARARFDAGSSPRLEVLQAELALAQAQNEATGAAGAAIGARAQFNALLGLEPDAPTTIVSGDLEPVITLTAAVARARANSELVVLDRVLDAQRARVELAKAMQTPDLTPDGSVTHGFADDAPFQTGWKAALTMTIPVFTTHKPGVALEEATLKQLEAQRHAAQLRIAAAVSATVAVADAQRAQYLRYRDAILPQAVEVETMADAAYRLGQTGITAYLQALQATREVRVRLLQAEAELHTALADLEQAMGAPPNP